MPNCISYLAALLLMAVVINSTVQSDEPPAAVQRWLQPQRWQRDTAGPVVPLGPTGAFDDTHIFAPTVGREHSEFLMWYCGSTGFAHDLAPRRTRDERVFRLGLARSPDGVAFSRNSQPVFELEDSERSIVTPSVLRNANGEIIREGGRIRMWFTSATLGGGGEPHSIHQAFSDDGVRWTDVSSPQLKRAYCPTVLKAAGIYRLWYSEPGRYPWQIRHATSTDGVLWKLLEEPVLKVSQSWEHDLQIYPCVLQTDDAYLMWYSSYLDKEHLLTGIGFAVSDDGINWHKHPDNPVLRPEPARTWESHYVSSHSVMRLDDGRFRIWYASRKAPPFQNLYFALNTAVWQPSE